MAGSAGRVRSLLCRQSAKCCRLARRPVPTRHRKGSPIMTATAIDSAVFRDISSTEAMRRVFSDENRIQKYLDFEAGLARAQARLGTRVMPAVSGTQAASTQGRTHLAKV